MNRVTQSNLLKLAAVFLFLQALIITLAPAVRARSLEVDYRWSQWIAYFVWGLSFYAHTSRSSGSSPTPIPISSP